MNENGRYCDRVTRYFGRPACMPCERKTSRRLAICHCRPDVPTYKGFEVGLAELGWREGDKIRIVRKFSRGDPSRLAHNAQEVVEVLLAENISQSEFTSTRSSLMLRRSYTSRVTGWSDLRNGFMAVDQEKTGKKLWILIHAELKNSK